MKYTEDYLDRGFDSVAASVQPRHPLEDIVGDKIGLECERLDNMSHGAFGSHAKLRRRMERSIVCQVRRLAPLYSSCVLDEIVNNDDQSLDFPDFIDLPKFR